MRLLFIFLISIAAHADEPDFGSDELTGYEFDGAIDSDAVLDEIIKADGDELIAEFEASDLPKTKSR